MSEQPWEWEIDGPESLAEELGERPGVVFGQKVVWHEGDDDA